jgi:hypothetical protein
MTLPLQLTFTGAVTINAGLTADQVQELITAALEATVTAPLANIDDALAALQAKADALAAGEAADRAAFDSLAAAVRAFIGSVSAGGALSADQQAHAQSILDSLDASAAVDTQQATDEAALQGEVPAPPAA